MTDSIKPIETCWNGYRFRSRLEARWAVFFTDLGLKWEYEPEGFQLPSGWYLPDFKVQYPGRDPSETHWEWFEVKGDLRTVTDQEWNKLVEFDKEYGLLVLDGTPALRMYNRAAVLCGAQDGFEKDLPLPCKLDLACEALGGEGGWALWSTKGRLWWDLRINFFCPPYGDDVRELAHAVDSARCARFEPPSSSVLAHIAEETCQPK